MRSKDRKNGGKIYQFPLPLQSDETPREPDRLYPHRRTSFTAGLVDIVISGTFRRDPEGLRLTYEQLRDLGFNVLSPTNTRIENEEDGFVYMEGESRYSPQEIELRHLEAIQRAALVWLHAPDGYIGVSGSLEIGFARAAGVPVYCQQDIQDPVLRQFVQKLPSPDRLVEIAEDPRITPPRPAIAAFQHYYKRAALMRGYDKEDARDTLILMLEEFGELAHAIRKRSKIARHGSFGDIDEGMELADVFLYVVHLANVLKLDLSAVVQQKELVNLRKLEQISS